MSERDDVVLDVRGVRTEFATHGAVARAVRGVDFTLRRGRKLAIVGESGCGKSALALSVLGLIEPPGRIVSGEVVLNGRDIAGLSDRELQRIRGREIAVVYQDPMGALDPVKTIGAQLVEALRCHQRGLSRRAGRARAAELLGEVDVPDPARRLDDYPHQYSGGMRQRVVIAMALANEPDVIVADEPTTALDVTTQAQVLEVLGRVVERHGTAVVLITHNLGVVAEFCDEVAVMYAGRIVERGDTRELFAAQAHPYTRALLASVPRPDRIETGPLPFIPGFPPSLAALPQGCSFEPRCPLGHGRERCRVERPEPRRAGSSQDAGGGVLAECHFAGEQPAPAAAQEATG